MRFLRTKWRDDVKHIGARESKVAKIRTLLPLEIAMAGPQKLEMPGT
jgi:hypothetical protein